MSAEELVTALITRYGGLAQSDVRPYNDPAVCAEVIRIYEDFFKEILNADIIRKVKTDVTTFAPLSKVEINKDILADLRTASRLVGGKIDAEEKEKVMQICLSLLKAFLTKPLPINPKAVDGRLAGAILYLALELDGYESSAKITIATVYNTTGRYIKPTALKKFVRHIKEIIRNVSA